MKVLFVCSGNMVRSQMAEAFYNSLTQSHDATSAGVTAIGADTASRRAMTVMQEIGMSLDGHYSKQLTPEMVDQADRVIVFAVPDLPTYITDSNKVERWDIEDLGFGNKESIALDRVVRDDIRQRVKEIVYEHTN